MESRGKPVWREPLASAVRQWLAELGAALGGGYEVAESEWFLVHAPRESGTAPVLLRSADRCRATLLSMLGDVADFDRFGKPVVLALRNRGEYYRYVSVYDQEGEYGESAGCHVREGYPHIVLNGVEMSKIEGALVHELTHVALHHLSLPQWLEEGLAQLVARDVRSSWAFGERTPGLVVNEEVAVWHQRYWRRRGLDAFWSGEAFSAAGRLGQLSYELAEILLQLLIEDSRRQLPAFVRAASESDGGEAACREHLGFGLGDLAARFLGPGPWSSS
jgi:hypothetical protein